VGAFALVLIVFGYLIGDPFLMMMSLMPIGVAAYHLPAQRNDRPQITVSDDGIRLDGMGLLPWPVIDEIELFDAGEEDGEQMVALTIVTLQSLEEIIDPQTDLTLLRTFQIMSWQLEDMHIIRVQLNLLDVDPEILYKDIWHRLNGDSPAYGEW
jgi:hypothetical protein